MMHISVYFVSVSIKTQGINTRAIRRRRVIVRRLSCGGWRSVGGMIVCCYDLVVSGRLLHLVLLYSCHQ